VNVKLVPIFCLCAALGLVACGSGDPGAGNPDSKLSAAEATAPIEGAPAELASIRAQANQVLDEGNDGYEQRLAELKASGIPVVVNKWASWCGPCRLEFPHFQSQAQQRGGEIAFLGVAANDSVPALETFLSELPLPYPSYYDPDMEISKELGGPTQAFPSTAFYDSSGELVFTKPGVYSDEADLAADIERYAR
jgi:cytochrome c biogenesis protein CcmG, thiol:disulfide interchange protein DsbE